MGIINEIVHKNRTDKILQQNQFYYNQISWWNRRKRRFSSLFLPKSSQMIFIWTTILNKKHISVWKAWNIRVKEGLTC